MATPDPVPQNQPQRVNQFDRPKSTMLYEQHNRNRPLAHDSNTAARTNYGQPNLARRKCTQ